MITKMIASVISAQPCDPARGRDLPSLQQGSSVPFKRSGRGGRMRTGGAGMLAAPPVEKRDIDAKGE